MINLDKYKTIAILGDRNTGKTNLIFYLAKNYKGNRQILLYAYPKSYGYKRIYSLEDLSLTTNSIILMDELQNHIKFYNKRTSEEFLELLAVMAHNNNTIIFTTPMSQFITKALDVFIDGFIYTRISDLGVLKNGSKAKRILQNNSFQQINKWSVNLDIGKCLVLCDYDKGVFNFNNQGINKDWKSV